MSSIASYHARALPFRFYGGRTYEYSWSGYKLHIDIVDYSAPVSGAILTRS